MLTQARQRPAVPGMDGSNLLFTWPVGGAQERTNTRLKGRRAGARRGVLVHGPEPAPLDAQDGDQLVQAEPLAEEQPVVRARTRGPALAVLPA